MYLVFDERHVIRNAETGASLRLEPDAKATSFELLLGGVAGGCRKQQDYAMACLAINAKALGSATAMSARIFRSSSICAFFKPAINLE